MLSRTSDICSRFESHLPDLLELKESGGQVSEAELEELLGHGAQCKECGELLRTYRATVSLLRELPRNPAPKDFLTWVKNGRESSRVSRGAGKKRTRAWLALAAVLSLSLTWVALWSFLEPAGRSSVLNQESAPGGPQRTPGGSENPAPPSAAAPAIPSRIQGIPPIEVLDVALLARCSPDEINGLEKGLRSEFEAGGSPREDSRPSLHSQRVEEEHLRDAALPPQPEASGAIRAWQSAGARTEFELKVDPAEISQLRQRVEGWAQKNRGKVISRALVEEKNSSFSQSGAARAGERESAPRVPVRIVVSSPAE